MINGKKIIVVLPAYNAALTLEKTLDEIPREVVDEILLVDDASSDKTVELSNQLGLKTYLHQQNYGYGRNQKTCYKEALKHQADVVIMLHPDYQYSPKLIPAMASMIAFGQYDVVIGSRFIGKGALEGGMPKYKYVANRFLTFFQNLLLNYNLSEYHTGFRAFNREVLENLPLEENSDDFVFDSEMITQTIFFNYRIGEISCPTKYFAEASSINFSRSVKYGLGVLLTSIKFKAQKLGLINAKIFNSTKSIEDNLYYKTIEKLK
jgi:glycosyltransferase involved in cell wall biosynthesis